MYACGIVYTADFETLLLMVGNLNVLFRAIF